jgi:hypothetical protein
VGDGEALSICCYRMQVWLPFCLHPAVNLRCSEMTRIPQVRGPHLRASVRLFTAEVRPVIAGKLIS